MKKIFKKDMKVFVQEQLKTNRSWKIKALLRIFKENQTSEEQIKDMTEEDNGIGFTGVDAFILSKLAKYYTRKGWLSNKQMEIVTKRLPKYWKQVIAMSDYDRLEGVYRKQNPIKGVDNAITIN